MCALTVGSPGCSGTVLVTWVHGILRHRDISTYCGQSGMFRDCLGNLGTRDTQTQGVCTYCGQSGMFRDCLGNLGTRDTQTQGACIQCGQSGMLRDCLGNLGTRDTQTQGYKYLLWSVRDIPGLSW